MNKVVTTIILATLLLLMMPVAVSAASDIEVMSKTGDGTWDEDTWQVEIYPGETKSTTLTLYNSSSSSLAIEVTIIPNSLDDGNLTFELDKTDFTMLGGTDTNVVLSVLANGSATPGAYTTTLTIKSEVSPSPILPPSGGVSIFRLYNLTIENITVNSADILWETSRPTTSILVYWSISETTIENETRIAEHTVHLEELEDDTTYYFEITCKDQYGLRKSDKGEFTTLKEEVTSEYIPYKPTDPVISEPEISDVEEPVDEDLDIEEPEESEVIEPEDERESQDLIVIEEPSRWSLLSSILTGLCFITLLWLIIWQWRKRRPRHLQEDKDEKD